MRVELATRLRKTNPEPIMANDFNSGVVVEPVVKSKIFVKLASVAIPFNWACSEFVSLMRNGPWPLMAVTLPSNSPGAFEVPSSLTVEVTVGPPVTKAAVLVALTLPGWVLAKAAFIWIAVRVLGFTTT